METPGLLLLIRAHQEMESLTLPADLLNTKFMIRETMG